jgi:hypothetical protein
MIYPTTFNFQLDKNHGESSRANARVSLLIFVEGNCYMAVYPRQSFLSLKKMYMARNEAATSWPCIPLVLHSTDYQYNYTNAYMPHVPPRRAFVKYICTVRSYEPTTNSSGAVQEKQTFTRVLLTLLTTPYG